MGTFRENENIILELEKGNKRHEQVCFLDLREADFKNLGKKYLWSHVPKMLKCKAKESGCF